MKIDAHIGLALSLAFVTALFVPNQIRAQKLPAAATDASQASPKAVIEETTYDAGPVVRGEIITHDFIVRNEGTGLLEISQVRPACGCTVATWDKTIAPGSTGKISASLRTRNYRGHILKTIAVVTNDPVHQNFQLAIAADVQNILKTTPRENQRFGLLPKGTTGKKVFHIVSTDNQPFVIKSVTAEDPELQFKIVESKDNKSLDFIVFLPANHGIGPIPGRFTLYTTHPKVAVVSLGVSGTIVAPLTVYPKVVQFSGLNHAYLKDHPDDASLVKAVVIASTMDPNLVIEKIDSSLKNIQTSLTEITPGKRYSIQLHLIPPLKMGTINGSIVIKTNIKTITVPVHGTVF